MGTGYTESIAKDISFKNFVLLCSRAFGALIELRDEPPTSDIPDVITPSDYHIKKIAEIKKNLKTFLSITDEEKEKAYDKEFKKDVAYYQKRKQEKHNLRQKYSKMLVSVESWIPPTKDHIGLKEFMQQQITDSIKWDCANNYPEEPKRKPTSDWYNAQIAELKSSLAYHEKENAEEINRAKECTEWIQQLKKSLPN